MTDVWPHETGDFSLGSATINGAVVRFAVAGMGPPVLLLHGWGGEIKSWGILPGALLDRGFRVLVLDLPGFGASSLPAAWSINDYARCVRELAAQVGIERCDIVAHSFGGRVALVLGATDPAFIIRLALMAPAGIRLKSFRLTVWSKVIYPVLRTFRRGAQSIGLRSGESIGDAFYRRVGAVDYANAQGTLRSTFVKVVREDLRTYARQVKAPTLLIWGELDRETPLLQGKILSQLIPDCGLVVIPGAGHFAYLERSDYCLTVIAHFLGR
ncbi:MAG: alpha/beta fold hydrolase [Chloroflexi bacterium]|nr:alpha/beta fold hydrolase [Chloroflexota bacterium]